MKQPPASLWLGAAVISGSNLCDDLGRPEGLHGVSPAFSAPARHNRANSNLSAIAAARIAIFFVAASTNRIFPFEPKLDHPLILAQCAGFLTVTFLFVMTPITDRLSVRSSRGDDLHAVTAAARHLFKRLEALANAILTHWSAICTMPAMNDAISPTIETKSSFRLKAGFSACRKAQETAVFPHFRYRTHFTAARAFADRRVIMMYPVAPGTDRFRFVQTVLYRLHEAAIVTGFTREIVEISVVAFFADRFITVPYAKCNRPHFLAARAAFTSRSAFLMRSSSGHDAPFRRCEMIKPEVLPPAYPSIVSPGFSISQHCVTMTICTEKSPSQCLISTELFFVAAY